jgi:hypothetical protein
MKIKRLLLYGFCASIVAPAIYALTLHSNHTTNINSTPIENTTSKKVGLAFTKHFKQGYQLQTTDTPSDASSWKLLTVDKDGIKNDN